MLLRSRMKIEEKKKSEVSFVVYGSSSFLHRSSLSIETIRQSIKSFIKLSTLVSAFLHLFFILSQS